MTQANDNPPPRRRDWRWWIRAVEVVIVVGASVYLLDFWLRRLPRLQAERQQQAAAAAANAPAGMQTIDGAVPTGTPSLYVTMETVFLNDREVDLATLAASPPAGPLVVLTAAPDVTYERVWEVARVLTAAGLKVALRSDPEASKETR